MCCSDTRKSETKEGDIGEDKDRKKNPQPLGNTANKHVYYSQTMIHCPYFFKPASHSNHIARLQAPSYLCIIKTESIKMIHYIFLAYIISSGRTFDHYKT